MDGLVKSSGVAGVCFRTCLPAGVVGCLSVYDRELLFFQNMYLIFTLSASEIRHIRHATVGMEQRGAR